ncbi:MAG: hypothetical protein ACJAYU_000916 [Bradymonadia bacterium]|jgi:hypothetical protein
MKLLRPPHESHIDGPPDPDGRDSLDESGVDLTQLRANLLLTPLQRIEAMVDAVYEIDRLQGLVKSQLAADGRELR